MLMFFYWPLKIWHKRTKAEAICVGTCQMIDRYKPDRAKMTIDTTYNLMSSVLRASTQNTSASARLHCIEGKRHSQRSTNQSHRSLQENTIRSQESNKIRLRGCTLSYVIVLEAKPSGARCHDSLSNSTEGTKPCDGAQNPSILEDEPGKVAE
jgi:hypothetical protein